ncbi:hypothetical protein HCJ93_15475 [Streptomyces sp. SBST2-5]|uniref:DUF6891 domain-containing protein n=1 Tax=Streptomyces composti TaxID=2720025 RepID=A0ABX1A569_9ACTN|nr:hypothetical protein [Streptomyces composti]NJP51430.1 hypothetical protein [Streptomyces composti]
MEIDEGLAVEAEAENGRTYTRVTAERLRELVLGLGGPGDRWLVLQRIPDLPDVFAQVWHESGGNYHLEHRLGARLLGAELSDAGRVADLMTGWARQEPDWDAGVAWTPVEPGPGKDAPEPPRKSADVVEELLRQRLHCGYDTRAELVETAVDHLVGSELEPLTRAQARALVDRLWAARIAEQRTWQGVTDPERLTRAFLALEAAGITARENFTCCRGCGLSEIGAERPGARGFVFFHQQSTESAAAGHGLPLYYGGFDGSADTTAAVGREVAAALHAEGLSTTWDGSPDRAIVAPLDWRKRLMG